MMKRTLRVLHSLPALQFAPFFVAAGLKLFEKEGVDVEMIFDGKRERSADLVQQRAVDCFLSGPLLNLDCGSQPPLPVLYRGPWIGRS
jgi:ABC-type nitrate/sulfonate/bicarbonate transport system substrate-binding protein